MTATDAALDYLRRGETCDRCGTFVRAWVFVDMPSGGSLSYCGHCGTRFWVALNEQAVAVHDFRYMIARAR